MPMTSCFVCATLKGRKKSTGTEPKFYDKKPPTEMSKGQSDNTNNAKKRSITQRLRTDLGMSVGVTTATQLVWLGTRQTSGIGK